MSGNGLSSAERRQPDVSYDWGIQPYKSLLANPTSKRHLLVQRDTVLLFPDDIVSLNGLAETLKQLGRLDEAVGVYRDAMQRFPHDQVARIDLAETLKALGRLDEALQLYEENLRLFPSQTLAGVGMAEVLRETGRFQEALVVLRETVTRSPGDLIAATVLADTLTRIGEQTESIALYRDLVARFPSNPVVRNGLAEALRRAANSEGAGLHARGPAKYRYQIAISFAGEDRATASGIAESLKAHGISVFYDDYEKDSLWGKDLYQHLARVYSEEAQYCILILSGHYARKLWPKHELQQAQARAFREKREYLLPVRLDDTAIPGINETIGYIDLRKDNVDTLVQAVLRKLASAE